jgi:hypothetical protein
MGAAQLETGVEEVGGQMCNEQVEADEECDDGNDADTDICTVNCVAAVCADGIVRAGLSEGTAGSGACDDGNIED